MGDFTTFKKGETVIIWNGTKQRNSVELAEVAKDSWYGDKEILITYGNFNTPISKTSIYKLHPDLKRELKALNHRKGKP